MDRRPLIGSYRKSVATAPAGMAGVDEGATESAPIVDRRVPVETPASTLSDGIREELQGDVSAGAKTSEKAKSYEELLAEHEISLQKAHTVVDSMLEHGYYEETIPLNLRTNQPVTVTFRTRTHHDYVRYLRALEVYAPKFIEEQQEIQMRYYLAASLVAYRGKLFSTESTQEAFDQRLDWVERQPAVMVNLLARKLVRFDLEIQIIMSEGVIENF